MEDSDVSSGSGPPFSSLVHGSVVKSMVGSRRLRNALLEYGRTQRATHPGMSYAGKKGPPHRSVCAFSAEAD